MIIGVSFWIGGGFQYDMIFFEQVSEIGLLRNGVTTGGVAAILMTLFVEMTRRRRSRIEATLEISVLPKIREFLSAFAVQRGLI